MQACLLTERTFYHLARFKANDLSYRFGLVFFRFLGQTSCILVSSVVFGCIVWVSPLL